MSDTKRTADESWYLPEYRQGEDELWDRLGDDQWQAVDGVLDVRLYVRWERDEPRAPITGLCIGGGPITADMLRAIPMRRLQSLPATPPPRLRQLAEQMGHDPAQPFITWLADDAFETHAPLVREKGEDPEKFADRVAMYYEFFAAISNKPAKEIADHSGVPVATVRGWIREARLRGKLPPGTQGKAG